jgi:urease accessory protein
MCLVTNSLSAHGSHGDGIIAGLTHPIFGLDHLLAISCIGFIIPTLKDKNYWHIPLGFTLAMAISGWMGIGTDGFMNMEMGIAASVVLLGTILALTTKPPYLLFAIASIIIAYFHGYAHGVEMPESSSAFVYIAGYSIGVMLLFLVSISLVNIMYKWNKPLSMQSVKAIGVCIMLAGLFILFG